MVAVDTITLDEPTLFDTFLYYGLFIGAIFQLACILAVVYIPHSENEEEMPEDASDTKTTSASPGTTLRKGGKKEKKKHR